MQILVPYANKLIKRIRSRNGLISSLAKKFTEQNKKTYLI